jgi:hypothetical protein
MNLMESDDDDGFGYYYCGCEPYFSLVLKALAKITAFRVHLPLL